MEGSSSAHRRQWKHNRGFLGSIPADYPDWIVTVAFYTALHAVDTLLAADKVSSVISHGTRNAVLMNTNRYKSIYSAYHPLYGLSRTVRYLADPAKWVSVEDIERHVLKGHLYRIERSVLKLLDDGTTLDAIAIAPKTAETQAESTSPASPTAR